MTGRHYETFKPKELYGIQYDVPPRWEGLLMPVFNSDRLGPYQQVAYGTPGGWGLGYVVEAPSKKRIIVTDTPGGQHRYEWYFGGARELWTTTEDYMWWVQEYEYDALDMSPYRVMAIPSEAG